MSSAERHDFTAGCRVPQPRRRVVRAGQHARAVGPERDRRDDSRVSAERRDFLAGGRIPQPRRVGGRARSMRAPSARTSWPGDRPRAAGLAIPRPVAASHSRAVLSPEPVSMRVPLGQEHGG